MPTESIRGIRIYCEIHGSGRRLLYIGARRQLEARAGYDTWDRLPTLPMPVYVCGGRHDGIAPTDNQAALAGAIPNARMERFEGGHTFLMQDRSAFGSIVEFLGEP